MMKTNQVKDHWYDYVVAALMILSTLTLASPLLLIRFVVVCFLPEAFNLLAIGVRGLSDGVEYSAERIGKVLSFLTAWIWNFHVRVLAKLGSPFAKRLITRGKNIFTGLYN